MKQKPRIYYSDSQKALMWERWRKGDSLQQIAQLFDRYHPSRRGFVEPMSGFDQIAGRFFEGNRPCASVPTSAPSGCLSNRSGASASFATLLLRLQNLMCCIDRLNPPAIAVSRHRFWCYSLGHLAVIR